ncbi:hypothetical protein B7C42_07613 [Nocardia cerradoensis]|uniref:Uncharacterized protein n=1 Tax=Nocardia cerradoensis TaxID=85688 RepID=A0A231GUQ4_9NOCA|nr:hypothetical protein B7C42_07613 [Nocardia cerradoensis]
MSSVAARSNSYAVASRSCGVQSAGALSIAATRRGHARASMTCSAVSRPKTSCRCGVQSGRRGCPVSVARAEGSRRRRDQRAAAGRSSGSGRWLAASVSSVSMSSPAAAAVSRWLASTGHQGSLVMRVSRRLASGCQVWVAVLRSPRVSVTRVTSCVWWSRSRTRKRVGPVGRRSVSGMWLAARHTASSARSSRLPSRGRAHTGAMAAVHSRASVVMWVARSATIRWRARSWSAIVASARC